MADTLNNTGAPVTTPVTPPQAVNPTPTNTPPLNINTGTQYEVQDNTPEDLDSQWTRWRCLICNYMYEGAKPIKKCPRCGNEDPDRFDDVD